MATTKAIIDPINELGGLLPGDALERLRDLLAEPDAELTPGAIVKLGAAFSDIGKTLTDSARSTMYDRLCGGVGESSREMDAGVLFQFKPPTTQTRINTALVKQQLPPEQYPDFWTTSNVKGTVAITL